MDVDRWVTFGDDSQVLFSYISASVSIDSGKCSGRRFLVIHPFRVTRVTGTETVIRDQTLY